MCGRYHLSPGDNFYTRFQITNRIEGIKTNYNVAPGLSMPIVYGGEKRQVSLMKWGLVPAWAKDPKIGNRLINARAETVAAKPSFRQAFQKKRCLVPASGFYEWQKAGNSKIPYYFHWKEQPLFSFAGLYEVWLDSQNRKLLSYTIITVTPNAAVGKIHDRMPAILPATEEKAWLDEKAAPDKLKLLLKALPDKQLEFYPVNSLINNPRENDAKLIKPIRKLF